MTSTGYRSVAPVVVLAAALLAAAPAQGAIPAGGAVVEGIGPSLGPIDTPGAALVKRLGLACAPASTGGATRRCYTSLDSALNYAEVNGGGKIDAWSFTTGAWRTPRGVGLGSSIAAIEPMAPYELSAEWACANGAPGRIADAATEPIFSTAGPVQTVPVDAEAIGFRVFSPECFPAPAPASVPVTLVLTSLTERVAQVTVPLAADADRFS